MGDTQRDYKHILSAPSELLAERAQNSQLRKDQTINRWVHFFKHNCLAGEDNSKTSPPSSNKLPTLSAGSGNELIVFDYNQLTLSITDSLKNCCSISRSNSYEQKRTLLPQILSSVWSKILTKWIRCSGMSGLQSTDVMLLTSAPCAETLTLQSNCKTGETEQPAHWCVTGEAISKCSIDPYFSISKQNPSREWWDPYPDKVCLHSFNLDKQSILVYNGFSVHISIPNDLYKKQMSLPWAQVRHRTCIEVKVSGPNTWWPLAGGVDTSSSCVV